MVYELHYDHFPSAAASSFRYALIPWDTSVFEFPMYQLECPAAWDEDFDQVFPNWLAALKSDKPTFVHTKIPPLALALARTLTHNGFYAIETMIYFRLSLDPYRRLHESLPPGMRFRPWRQEDLEQTLTLAESSIRNDRFHLDPNLSAESADKRYRTWMLNAIRDREPTFVLEEEANNRLVGFAIMRPTAPYVMDTNLLAIAPEYRKKSLGLMFFGHVCELLESQSYKQVTADASINNLSSVNLANLGFRAHFATTTYHWFHPGGRQ